MEKVIIGVDPHKLSATIEVVDEHEQVLGSGRFSTDQAGYTAMRSYTRAWPGRVWAVEGSNGAGRPLAQPLPGTPGRRPLDSQRSPEGDPHVGQQPPHPRRHAGPGRRGPDQYLDTA
jgi:hypothetical protein